MHTHHPAEQQYFNNTQSDSLKKKKDVKGGRESKISNQILSSWTGWQSTLPLRKPAKQKCDVIKITRSFHFTRIKKYSVLRFFFHVGLSKTFQPESPNTQQPLIEVCPERLIQ